PEGRHPPETAPARAARPPAADRRGAGDGPDARGRARPRPDYQRTGDHRDGRRPRTLQGARPAGRQGGPLRKRPPDQAADVLDGRRRRLPRRLSRRGPDPPGPAALTGNPEWAS